MKGFKNIFILELLFIVGLIIIKILLNFQPAANRIPTRVVQNQVTSRSITNDLQDVKRVALTFDDGPSPTSTQIMEILLKKQVPATFFVVGKNVDEYPDILKQEIKSGFAVGSHTNTHPNRFWMFIKTPSSFSKDVIIANEKIYQTTGIYPQYFRFPYGWHNQTLDHSIHQLGLITVSWNVDPQDWSKPGKEKILAQVMKEVMPNSVILLHDGPASQDRSQTIAALPTIIDTLQTAGYEFVSLDKIDLNNLKAATPAASKKPTTIKTQQTIIKLQN